MKEIKDELKKELPEGDAAAAKKLSKYYELLREKIFRDQVLNERIRPDHRAFDEIRDLTIEVGRAAARAWFGAVYSWRDAGAGDVRRWARPTMRSGWRATRASRSGGSCCTTTSRRSRLAKWAA